MLEKAARDLISISDIVHDETERMAVAEKRFADRRGTKRREAS